MNMYKHVMLDLETMGNKSNTALTSLGAVEFNIETGEYGEQFYMPIDLGSSLNVGLKINSSTVYWWLKQNDEARLKMCEGENGPTINEVLIEFSKWFNYLSENNNYTYIWGNGARFDIGLLEDAYVACGLKTPWYFRNELDLRTLVFFAPEIKKEIVANTDGPAHDPIFDCKLQIQYATKIWNKMKINK